MIDYLRHKANETAQACFHEANEYLFRKGRRSATLDARYQAAERLVDWIDEYAASLPDIPVAMTPDPGDWSVRPTGTAS